MTCEEHSTINPQLIPKTFIWSPKQRNRLLAPLPLVQSCMKGVGFLGTRNHYFHLDTWFWFGLVLSGCKGPDSYKSNYTIITGA